MITRMNEWNVSHEQVNHEGKLHYKQKLLSIFFFDTSVDFSTQNTQELLQYKFKVYTEQIIVEKASNTDRPPKETFLLISLHTYSR